MLVCMSMYTTVVWVGMIEAFVCAYSTYVCISYTTVQRCIWMLYARGPRERDVVLPFTLAGFSAMVRHRRRSGETYELVPLIRPPFQHTNGMYVKGR